MCSSTCVSWRNDVGHGGLRHADFEGDRRRLRIDAKMGDGRTAEMHGAGGNHCDHRNHEGAAADHLGRGADAAPKAKGHAEPGGETEQGADRAEHGEVHGSRVRRRNPEGRREEGDDAAADEPAGEGADGAGQ